MIEAAKEFLEPKTFGVVAYQCVIAHFLCGFAFTVVTATLTVNEEANFFCCVHDKASIADKEKVETPETSLLCLIAQINQTNIATRQENGYLPNLDSKWDSS